MKKFFSVILFFLSLLFIILFFNNNRVESYENINVKYDVYLFNDNFINHDINNISYISSNIDKIGVTFEYYNSLYNDLYYNYSYTLEIVDNFSGKVIYSHNDSYDNNLIDYKYFDDYIKSIIKEYNLSNVNSYLIINCDVYNNNFNKNINFKVPLNEKIVYFDNYSSQNNYVDNNYNYYYLVISFILIIASFYINRKHSANEFAMKYKNDIICINNNIEINNKSIIEVKNMNELLKIKDLLMKPILYRKSNFFIIDNSLIYLYALKKQDI